MKKDYSQSAEKLMIALGGKSNVTRMFHCMTRLRFYVKKPQAGQRSRYQKAA